MTSPAQHAVAAPSDERTAQIGRLLAQLAALMSEPPQPVQPEPSPSPRTLFTVQEAADQLGIGKTTAYALVRSGDLESVRIGRLRRIPASAISSYAARLVAKNRTV